MRGATIWYRPLCPSLYLFQSTRPMRGATATFFKFPSSAVISLHAPPAGRDCYIFPRPAQPCNFNPRAPCGARLQELVKRVEALEFQSTRPMRGATAAQACDTRNTVQFQSTRPMRGATIPLILSWPRFDISIHAPHAGRDYF